MLPVKIRFPLLAVLALLVLGMALTGQAPQAEVAQQPAQPKKKERKLQDLLEERLAVAQMLAKQNRLRLANNQGRIEEAIEPTRLALEAALELCKTDKERITVLGDFLKAAREIERIATTFEKSGQGRAEATLLARLERLRVEIALARAKAGVKTGKAPTKAEAVQPKKVENERVCTQPATIQAYETVNLFARVPGFLKSQAVDIGDRVKRGQVLAVVDVPELEAQVQLERASLVRAHARVLQAKARVSTAKAEADTAKLVVKQADATLGSAAASTRFREAQLKRLKALFENKSIDQRLLDESMEQYSAALEAEKSARVAIETARSQVTTAATKIDQAKADLVEAEAALRVADARIERARVHLSFATIAAPMDGVITRRNYTPGDFVRSANNAADHKPLFTLQRTDRLRVVVAIPERDAPFIQVGALADVEIDALLDRKWTAKVSRIAAALDPKTRTMNAELDLANPTGLIRPGLWGRVVIRIDSTK